MEQSKGTFSTQAAVSLKDCKRFNYGIREYAGRLLWRLCWRTLWKLCWKRLYSLRVILLKIFGARLSRKNQMDATTWIEIPWNLTMGEYCAIGPRVHLYNLGAMSIGSNTVISQDSYLCGGTHDYASPDMPLVKAPIIIGNQVWICAGAFIGPGVTVGEGAVIGARAVVVKDVAPWTVVAGNPARVIRRREIRESLK
jgi:putative colanic acid biosynthesis acetyltransferase WcaF